VKPLLHTAAGQLSDGDERPSPPAEKKADQPPELRVAQSEKPPRARRLRGLRRRRLSTLTLRILAPNVLALLVLAGGILYLDQYRDGLLDAKVAALQTQAEIMAGALGQTAVSGPASDRRVDRRKGRELLQRLVQPAGVRARLYDRDGELLADTRELAAEERRVSLRYLPPPGESSQVMELLEEAYDWLLPKLPQRDTFARYEEYADREAPVYPEIVAALGGQVGGDVRTLPDRSLVITVAVPVQPLRQVLGALMLSSNSQEIEDGVRSARLTIIQAFAVAVAVTIALSLFLTGTISRPVRQLAEAADRVRHWRGQRVQIPDISQRGDEIGDLSASLRDMTRALYDRLDAIEVFAADVAHEIKNPLTSLRSALETFDRTDDGQQRARLLAVMAEDVLRLDRLITDITNASRVDAEMARAEAETIDFHALLLTVAEIYRSRNGPDAPRLHLSDPPAPSPFVEGVPGRLAQVVENLLANALSFSPPDREIRVGLSAGDGMAVLTVEDFGPGLPPGKEEAIFERFYSQRGKQQESGRHSGLGLSICRQIVEAHGGDIRAENHRERLGGIAGARFIVRLPLV
jgi:two-component system sensor histidine kinase ChvG